VLERPLLWQATLLAPEPTLSLVYLLGIRAGRVKPAFGPMIALGLLPVASIVFGVVGLRRPESGNWSWHVGLLVVGALEIVWAVIASSIVGFAIAWRSG
jgi:hypothetical protein